MNNQQTLVLTTKKQSFFLGDFLQLVEKKKWPLSYDQNSAAKSAHINSANIILGKLEPPSTNSTTKNWLIGILPQKNQPNPKCFATIQNDQTNNLDKI
jgi:hypothetical protein